MTKDVFKAKHEAEKAVWAAQRKLETERDRLEDAEARVEEATDALEEAQVAFQAVDPDALIGTCFKWEYHGGTGQTVVKAVGVRDGMVLSLTVSDYPDDFGFGPKIELRRESFRNFLSPTEAKVEITPDEFEVVKNLVTAKLREAAAQDPPHE